MRGTISGSFRKFYREICEAYEIFEQNNIAILSPRKSRIINPGEEFAILEKDPVGLTKKQLEDRHLKAITNSNFLYVVNPNGYIGDSVKFEIGYAYGKEKPIYSSDLIEDIVLREYITEIFSPQELCDFLKHFKSD